MLPFCVLSLLLKEPLSPQIYTLSLHDALPICICGGRWNIGKTRPTRFRLRSRNTTPAPAARSVGRSEEHTSELQSLRHLVCRLLLEKKNKNYNNNQKILTKLNRVIHIVLDIVC